MAADVEIDISVRKRGDGADKVARDLKGAARAADDFADELAKVERRLIEVKALSAAAGKEFLKTGDSSPLKQLLKDERELKQVKKSLTDVTSEVKTLAKAGEGTANLFEGVTSGLGKLAANPELVAAGAAAAAPIAAGLGAALAGATLAGTAAAGLAGGIVLAAGDSRVHNAFAEVGHTALTELQDASTVFVGPLESAAHTFGDTVHDLMPQIRKDFEVLAPSVDHVAGGVAGFVKALSPGLSSAFAAGGPVLDQLADELPRLGGSVGFFFDQLAQGAHGGGDALVLTLKAAEFAIEALGSGLHDASVAFELFSAPLIAVTNHLGGMDVAVRFLTGSGFVHLAEALTETDDKTKKTTDSQGSFSDGMRKAADAAAAEAAKTRELAQELDNAVHATDRMISSMLGLDGATNGYNSSVTSLKESIKQNGHTLDEHTAAGQRNRAALLSGVQAAEQLREQMIANGQSTAYANQVYEQNINQLKGVYGNTKQAAAAVGDLLNKYGDLSRAPNIAKTITITERFKTVGQRGAAGNVGIGGQAFQGAFFDDGGWVQAPAGQPVPAIVHGGEYVLSRDMLAGRAPTDLGAGPRPPIATTGARATAGNSTYHITVNAGVGADGRDVGSQIVAVIKQYEQRNGTVWRAG